VLLSLLFSASEAGVGSRLVLLIMFAALVLATAAVVSFAGRSRRRGGVLLRLQDTTAEIRIRGAVVLLVAFVVLAERFGLESNLGAFLARNTGTRPALAAALLQATSLPFIVTATPIGLLSVLILARRRPRPAAPDDEGHHAEPEQAPRSAQ
jgi:hypothetical protein